MVKSDEELFEAFRQGDDQAFSLLVERYQKPLFQLIYRLTGDVNLTEEIFQETFVRVFRFQHTFDSQRSFRTWIYTICLHLCRDAWKQKSQRVRPFSTFSEEDEEVENRLPWSLEDQPEEKALAKEVGHLVEEAMAKLSPKHREVLVLFHFHGLTYEEIAEILGRKVGTVKSQVHYALKYLRQFLEAKAHDLLGSGEPDSSAPARRAERAKGR